MERDELALDMVAEDGVAIYIRQSPLYPASAPAGTAREGVYLGLEEYGEGVGTILDVDEAARIADAIKGLTRRIRTERR